MRKKILTSVIVSSVLFLGACGNVTPSNTKNIQNINTTPKILKTVKVAVHVPMTGSNAMFGESIELGSKLAIEENKNKFESMGIKLELETFDDQGNPTVGAANAKDIVKDPEILAMVGNFNSGVVRASLPTYNEAKLAVVSPGASAVDLTQKGGVFHRINAHDDLQAEASAKYVKNDLNLNKVYILSDDTYYSKDLTAIYEKTAKEIGLQVVGKNQIASSSMDFAQISNEILSSKPDVVFFPGVYGQVGSFTKYVKDAGYKGIIFSGDSADSPDLLKLTGPKYIKDVYLTALAGDLTLTNTGKEFKQKIESSLGKTPGNLSSFGYDATLVVLNGIEEAYKQNGNKIPTREEVLNQIDNTKDFKGKFTKVTFDEKGDNIYSDIFIFNFATGEYPGTTVGVVSSDE